MDNMLEFIKLSKEKLKQSIDKLESLESDLKSDKLTTYEKERRFKEARCSVISLESVVNSASTLEFEKHLVDSNKLNNISSMKSVHTQAKSDDILESDPCLNGSSIGNGLKEVSEGYNDIYNGTDEQEQFEISVNNLSLNNEENSSSDCVIVENQSKMTLFDKIFLRNGIGKEKIGDNKLIVRWADEVTTNSSEKEGFTTHINEKSDMENQLLPCRASEDLALDEAEDDIAKRKFLTDSDDEDDDGDNENMNNDDKENKQPELIKECSVVLYDISIDNPELKFQADKEYYDRLEKEVKNLCKIPGTVIRKPVKNGIFRSKVNSQCRSKRKTQNSESESSNMNSDSDISDSNRSGSVIIGKVDEAQHFLSSTMSSSNESESNYSDDSFTQKGKQIKARKSTSSKQLSNVTDNKTKRRTRSMKIPKSDSDSEKNANTRGKKRSQPIYCSSTSSNESDASASDLRKTVGGKKQSTTKKSGAKGKSKRQKLNRDNVKDEDDGNDAEGETRKHIRNVMSKSKLSEATKNATQLETERRKRIEERQKQYNTNSTKEDSVNESKQLILELDNDGAPLIQVDPEIVKHLKPHQFDAVRFLWDCVIENTECLKKSKESKDSDQSSSIGGCILAHCMGLGKTLSLIAFMHTMLTNELLDFKTCLVVCPVNTALNWKREWEMWMPSLKDVDIYEICSNESKKYKTDIVQEWIKHGGVLIIGYEMYRLLASGDNRTLRRKVLRQKMSEALVDPGPDFVVCDEGHLLKNDKSTITKVIRKLKTKHRIVLTGTPLQNRLIEYYTMVSFVKPSLLGTQKEFLNQFVNPIKNGQHIDSTPYDVKLMKKRSHILYKTLDGCVQRKDYSALVKYLPTKYEYVLKIRLSDVQIQLYREYLKNSVCGKNHLFEDQLMLSRIWGHPIMIRMHQDVVDKRAFLADTDEDSFIDDGSDDDSSCSGKKKKIGSKSQDDDIDNDKIINLLSDNSDPESNSKEKVGSEKSGSKSSSDEEIVRNWCTSTRSRRKLDICDSDEEKNIPMELQNVSSEKYWFSDILQNDQEESIEISGKLTILFQILRKSSDIGDKVIVFSHSLFVLDAIELFLKKLNVLSEGLKKETDQSGETINLTIPDEDNKSSQFLSDIGYNTWEKGIDYDRMDGSTLASTRADIQAKFNSTDDQRLRLFLISTRAGGMGVNLVAANRIVIFDVSWNPSHDIQAIFRAYRFGQTKPVYVYRLVSQGTMEEKMYERQVTKQALSLRVIDEQQISRYFTEEDLRSLYKFEPDVYDPSKPRETPILPKDRFLAELIKEFPNWIFGYHEHDSLLQNKDEEELTEAERQDAWTEFEEEKVRGTRPPPITSHTVSGAHNQSVQYQMMQLNDLLNRYPHLTPIYSQNYPNLMRFVLNQNPDLKHNPVLLNVEIQNLFMRSLEKQFRVSFGSQNGVIASQIQQQTQRQQLQQQQQQKLQQLLLQKQQELLQPQKQVSSSQQPETDQELQKQGQQ